MKFWYVMVPTCLGIFTLAFFYLRDTGKKGKQKKKAIPEEEENDSKKKTIPDNEITVISYLMKKLDERDDDMKEIMTDMREKTEKIIELNNNVKDSEHSLHILGVDYLRKTCSMHERGILELFQKLYVDHWPGSPSKKWEQFLTANNPVAGRVMSELWNQNIDVAAAVTCATDLYRKLSGHLHNALTSADNLYLVQEHFSLNQMPFMVAISKHVIDESKIVLIKEAEWKNILKANETV